MANGSITTARGMSLNIDEIIQQAQRPAGMVDEASTRDTGNFKTAVLNAPRVRGLYHLLVKPRVMRLMVCQNRILQIRLRRRRPCPKRAKPKHWPK